VEGSTLILMRRAVGARPGGASKPNPRTDRRVCYASGEDLQGENGHDESAWLWQKTRTNACARADRPGPPVGASVHEYRSWAARCE
jgi:hypothetical protein